MKMSVRFAIICSGGMRWEFSVFPGVQWLMVTHPITSEVNSRSEVYDARIVYRIIYLRVTHPAGLVGIWSAGFVTDERLSDAQKANDRAHI